MSGKSEKNSKRKGLTVKPRQVRGTIYLGPLRLCDLVMACAGAGLSDSSLRCWQLPAEGICTHSRAVGKAQLYFRTEPGVVASRLHTLALVIVLIALLGGQAVEAFVGHSPVAHRCPQQLPHAAHVAAQSPALCSHRGCAKAGTARTNTNKCLRKGPQHCRGSGAKQKSPLESCGGPVLLHTLPPCSNSGWRVQLV